MSRLEDHIRSYGLVALLCTLCAAGLCLTSCGLPESPGAKPPLDAHRVWQYDHYQVANRGHWLVTESSSGTTSAAEVAVLSTSGESTWTAAGYLLDRAESDLPIVWLRKANEYRIEWQEDDSASPPSGYWDLVPPETAGSLYWWDPLTTGEPIAVSDESPRARGVSGISAELERGMKREAPLSGLVFRQPDDSEIRAVLPSGFEFMALGWSASGRYFAVLESSVSSYPALLVLSAETGEVVASHSSPGGPFEWAAWDARDDSLWFDAPDGDGAREQYVLKPGSPPKEVARNNQWDEVAGRRTAYLGDDGLGPIIEDWSGSRGSLWRLDGRAPLGMDVVPAMPGRILRFIEPGRVLGEDTSSVWMQEIPSGEPRLLWSDAQAPTSR